MRIHCKVIKEGLRKGSCTSCVALARGCSLTSGDDRDVPDYGDAELKTWAERVSQQNWKEAFIFFKHEDEGMGPKMAKRFLELAS